MKKTAYTDESRIKTMTTATEIMSVARNANDAIARAEALTTNINQDWDHEATIYTFDDESVLVVSGPQANAFPSITDWRHQQ